MSMPCLPLLLRDCSLCCSCMRFPFPVLHPACARVDLVAVVDVLALYLYMIETGFSSALAKNWPMRRSSEHEEQVHDMRWGQNNGARSQRSPTVWVRLNF